MRNLMLTWFGVVLTFVATFLAVYFSPTPLPLSEKIWFFGMCALCVLMLALTYLGWPRDRTQPFPRVVRGLAVVAMLFSGGAWVWLIVRTVMGEESGLWAVRIQRTLALVIFAWAYYVVTQKPKQTP